MARYIDADKLGIGKADRNAFIVPEYADGWNSAIEIISNAPTADVVPKSEVEALKDDNKFLQDRRFKELSEVRQEVAREIFEEIEKKVKASLTIHLEEINKEHIKDTPLYDRHSGIIFAMQGMDDFIAELKKKYTEGD